MPRVWGRTLSFGTKHPNAVTRLGSIYIVRPQGDYLIKHTPQSVLKSCFFFDTPSIHSSSSMASHPAQKCCAIGVKHEGTPQGEIKTITGDSTHMLVSNM